MLNEIERITVTACMRITLSKNVTVHICIIVAQKMFLETGSKYPLYKVRVDCIPLLTSNSHIPCSEIMFSISVLFLMTQTI